jgi:predicted fused transcriptional regulator/phosphomethylpyrimidine kinase/predicted transcriptional regulator
VRVAKAAHMLRLPSEIVVDRVLPTLRILLARELASREFTQEEIANRLGVTQATVSTYLGGGTAVEERVAEHPQTRETVERIAEGFAGGSMDDYDAISAILALIREFEDRGPICELHEEAVPGLQGLGCDLCVRGTDERLGAEREALADVRAATRTLATTPGMAEFVPNVGTNVGRALPDAADPSDVAAIPGRIHPVGGRVEVPANPEFGASRNVATVVLAAAATDSGTRGALNLVTDDAIIAAARERGIEPLAFDADYDERGRRLRERFEDVGVSRVVYHRGAFGIEPVTYVLGGTADEAATLAATLVDAAHDRR